MVTSSLAPYVTSLGDGVESLEDLRHPGNSNRMLSDSNKYFFIFSFSLQTDLPEESCQFVCIVEELFGSENPWSARVGILSVEMDVKCLVDATRFRKKDNDLMT